MNPLSINADLKYCFTLRKSDSLMSATVGEDAMDSKYVPYPMTGIFTPSFKVKAVLTLFAIVSCNTESKSCEENSKPVCCESYVWNSLTIK